MVIAHEHAETCLAGEIPAPTVELGTAEFRKLAMQAPNAKLKKPKMQKWNRSMAASDLGESLLEVVDQILGGVAHKVGVDLQRDLRVRVAGKVLHAL